MSTHNFEAQTQYIDYTGTSACEQSNLKVYLETRGLIQKNEFIVDFSFTSSDNSPISEFNLVVFLVKDFNYEIFQEKLKNGENLNIRKVETEINADDLFSNIRRIEVQFSWKGLLTNSTHPYLE